MSNKVFITYYDKDDIGPVNYVVFWDREEAEAYISTKKETNRWHITVGELQ